MPNVGILSPKAAANRFARGWVSATARPSWVLRPEKAAVRRKLPLVAEAIGGAERSRTSDCRTSEIPAKAEKERTRVRTPHDGRAPQVVEAGPLQPAGRRRRPRQQPKKTAEEDAAGIRREGQPTMQGCPPSAAGHGPRRHPASTLDPGSRAHNTFPGGKRTNRVYYTAPRGGRRSSGPGRSRIRKRRKQTLARGPRAQFSRLILY